LIRHSHGFAEKPAFKPMFGARIRAAECWHGLRCAAYGSAFDRRHHKKLDQENEASITPPPGYPNPAFPATPRLDRHGSGVPSYALNPPLTAGQPVAIVVKILPLW
jgi:hypothetical protein